MNFVLSERNDQVFPLLFWHQARFQPDISFTYLRDLLGKDSLSHPAVEELSKYIFYGNRLVERTAKTADDNSEYRYLAVVLDDSREIPVLELAAMLLEQARLMVEKDAGTKVSFNTVQWRLSKLIPHQVVDAVLTAPSYFTQRERQALIDAAEIAGINVLSLINEPTAFALQYAIDFAAFTEPKNVLFVDLGDGALELSMFKFDLVPGKDKKNVTQVLRSFLPWIF